MEDGIDLRYLIGALRRRWLLIALPAMIGGALAVALALLLPPVYTSTARILVEGQQIPAELARSTVAVNAAQRISVIEERLSARQNMLELANRYQVFAGRGALSQTEIVDRMRAATRIRTTSVSAQRGSRGDATVATVEIAFSAGRAATAAQVANEYLTQVLALNIKQRSDRASETLDFFSREVERLAAELAAVETRISTFKSDNQAALPESIEFRRSELGALQRDSFVAESRRLSLLEAKRALEDAIALGEAVIGGQPGSPREAELLRLRSALAQQSAVLSATHPTIRSLTAQIAALDAQPTPASDAPAPASGRATEALREVERIEAEIALLDEQRARDAARTREIDAALARAPEVAIQLGALTREQMSLQAQYQQAVLKRAEAATGERLEVNQQAERFEVIEQPQTPERPVSPNRLLIAGGGGVLSVGFGLALAVLAELLNPALRAARDLERALDVRPLATIPYIRTAAELRWRRLAVWTAGFGLLVLIPGALWTVDTYITPLPLLAERVMTATRLGEFISVIQGRLGG